MPKTLSMSNYLFFQTLVLRKFKKFHDSLKQAQNINFFRKVEQVCLSVLK